MVRAAVRTILDDQTPWRVKRERGEEGAIRSSKFGVQSSENLELRTSNLPPSRASRVSRAVILRGVLLLLGSLAENLLVFEPLWYHPSRC